MRSIATEVTLNPVTVKANMAPNLKPSQRLTDEEVMARTCSYLLHCPHMSH